MAEEHYLTLKVMRLTKPKLQLSSPLLCEAIDLPGSILSDALADSITTIKGCEMLRISEALTLPQNFGNIYLGDTFSSIVSVHNDSANEVNEVVTKIELRTTQHQPFSLLKKPEDGMVKVLDGHTSSDLIVNHEVKELNQHTLICSVSYTINSVRTLERRQSSIQPVI